MGRHRSFVPDEALDRVAELFSRRGFDGASIEDLCVVTGISRPSLYGTFGDKRRLYLSALRHRGEQWLEELRGAMTEHTASDVVLQILRLSAASWNNHWLGANGFTVGVPEDLRGAGAAGNLVSAYRNQAERLLGERLQQARGDVSRQAEKRVAIVARCILTIADGVAAQSQLGVSRAAVHELTELALQPLLAA